MIDPYPTELLNELPSTAPDPLVNAITRLAQAIEQNTLAILGRPSQTPAAVLTPLPPVRTVANKPPCPKHGLDKVQSSTKFAGFYCTAKDPMGPRGYCTWDTNGNPPR